MRPKWTRYFAMGIALLLAIGMDPAISGTVRLP